MDAKDIESRFRHHPLKVGQSTKYDNIRDTAHRLATLINYYCPESREKSLAVTKLEEAVMWANAAIARNE